MEKIQHIKDHAVLLEKDNIDTDQIIPARFLKATSREGFGKNLFSDWRYDQEGKAKSDFVLNQPNGLSKILLTGNNFGCGSSREHAAWALYDYGFRVIISTFFADIFRENALNNGILPLQVSEEFHQILTEEVHLDPTTKIVVDLEQEIVRLQISGESERFSISPYKKECLLKGYDDLDYLIGMIPEIEAFEEKKQVNVEV